MFLNAFNKLKEPYYLLSTNSNNSLASSLEILTYLNNNNYKGEILHGSIDYISKRIMELVNSNYDRLGVIGKPSDWLIASIPEYENIKKLYGINLKLESPILKQSPDLINILFFNFIKRPPSYGS